MKTQTALEVAEKCPNFTSQVIESLWERLDVHTLRTTAYHPQTDGITERFNRTIKTMLTQFVNEQKQDDWDLKLDKLSFAYIKLVQIFIRMGQKQVEADQRRRLVNLKQKQVWTQILSTLKMDQ